LGERREPYFPLSSILLLKLCTINPTYPLLWDEKNNQTIPTCKLIRFQETKAQEGTSRYPSSLTRAPILNPSDNQRVINHSNSREAKFLSIDLALANTSKHYNACTCSSMSSTWSTTSSNQPVAGWVGPRGQQ
jgi:hypothetical protein